MTMNLEPQWIVGFVDGEGCFNLDVHIHKEMRWKLQMQPEFTVVQNEIDIQVLEALKAHFKCGNVTVNRKDKNGTRYHYRVKNVKDLHEKILPFFEKHKLKTKKRVEFERFRTIVRLMYSGYHNESLTNFLEVIQKGMALREKQNSFQLLVSNPSSINKRAKVAAQIQKLEELLLTSESEKL